jgi:hypothetical protein
LKTICEVFATLGKSFHSVTLQIGFELPRQNGAQCELVHTALQASVIDVDYARSCAPILFVGSAAHGGGHPNNRTGACDLGAVSHRAAPKKDR